MPKLIFIVCIFIACAFTLSSGAAPVVTPISTPAFDTLTSPKIIIKTQMITNTDDNTTTHIPHVDDAQVIMKTIKPTPSVTVVKKQHPSTKIKTNKVKKKTVTKTSKEKAVELPFRTRMWSDYH